MHKNKIFFVNDLFCLSTVDAYSRVLKASTRKQTDFLPKLLDLPTISSMKTDEMFTKLLIQHGRKPVEEQNNSGREEYLGSYGQVSGTQVKTFQEIFVGIADGKENPRSILLTGKAGIGKSLFCQKLIRDWAHDALFQTQINKKIRAFKFAYLLTFRQLNLLGDETTTFKEILNCSSILDDQSDIDDSLFDYIVNHSKNVLIVIDGFDEYSQGDYIAGDAHERYPNSAHARMPVSALCAKLIRGKILGQSTVMITSRPDESDRISGIRFDRDVEITGFSEQEVKEYIEKYFREGGIMKNTVLEHITRNENLVSFAHIPVLCAMMCSYMEYILTESNSTSDLPISASALYFEFLNIFELKHNKSFTSHHDETTLTMDKLSEFAAQLLVDKKFLYSEEDMKTFNAQEIESLRASGLRHCCPPFRKSFSQTIKYFCFTHLTLLEYLAARWFVKRREIPSNRKVSTMVVQFMAGILSKEKDNGFMEELLKKLPTTIESQNFYEEVFPSARPICLIRAKCLSEHQDKGFAKHSIKSHHRQYSIHYGYIFFKKVNDVDCSALSYLLDIISEMNEEENNKKHQTFSEQPFIVKSLEIQFSNLKLSGVKRICKSLEKDSCLVTRLKLFGCGLNDECVNCICGLASRKLNELQLLENSKITDNGIFDICQALKKRSCKVTSLHLPAQQPDHRCRVCQSMSSSERTKLYC